ncbi:MAG: sugar phosphate isomerase/epimerase and 4-hydroxyphenylpyruvate domain-containing protein [Alphaproteobacteria bacterium]|nr:sugar phosphate isomerase/epimerase and 4-hydroxyphenylpyruvate domain-containing protein [Alphaproteobacteria bacterium]
MNLTIATTSVLGLLSEKIDIIAQAGFKGIELHQRDFICSNISIKTLKQQITSLGLTIEVLQPCSEIEGLPDGLKQAAFKNVTYQFELMQQLDINCLLVGASKHMETSENQVQQIEDLTLLAQMAAQYNVRIAYMASPWAKYVNNDLQAYDIVTAVNHPNFGLCLNSFFSLADGSMPAKLRDIDGSKIFYVQLSDAPKINGDIRFLKRQISLLPGQGELNLQGFVQMIARNGYQGAWAISRIRDNARTSAKIMVRDAYRSLVSLLDDVQNIDKNTKFKLPALPKRVYPLGFEFIEFAVDDDHYQPLSNMLQSLCFRKEKNHIKKAVELWRQGAVLMIINREKTGFVADYLKSNGASVCAMGIRVENANQTVERAKKLGAEIFNQQTYGVSIPAIKSDGGTIINFIDENSDLHKIWNIEFDYDKEFENHKKNSITAPACIRRIDHISLVMDYDDMQSWLLYYLATFQMHKAKIVDVADPFGTVKSQSIASPEGEVRINLNGASSAKTLAGAFLDERFEAGVQHIALASDDIFETSKWLLANDFPRLQISPHYYDALTASTALDEQTIQTMQAENILYSKSENGEFFQIYSTPFLGGFFFEIVERRVKYNGYGSSNAPIRLASMRKHYQESEVTNG